MGLPKCLGCLRCGTHSLQNSAMVIAIIDVIATTILLILFVLGSSLMLAFQIVGKPHNATRVLDIVTDDVFGQVQTSYDTIREKKDVAEDMGVWLIVMFLTIVDFVISCIFLDGVKTRNPIKCQTWLNIRIVVIVVFKIIVMINLVYGTSKWRGIPDMIFTVYRVLGLCIGYYYLQELREMSSSEVKSSTEVAHVGGTMMKGNSSFVNPIPIPSASIVTSEIQQMGKTSSSSGSKGKKVQMSFPSHSDDVEASSSSGIQMKEMKL